MLSTHTKTLLVLGDPDKTGQIVHLLYQKKKGIYPNGYMPFLVRETGLEGERRVDFLSVNSFQLIKTYTTTGARVISNFLRRPFRDRLYIIIVIVLVCH